MHDERHPGPKDVSRRQARRDAMVILYQKIERDRGYVASEYTQLLVTGVLSMYRDLDRSIDENSKNWQSSRMGALERNILRIAVFEIREREDIAFETSVDEAVTLAKRFCSYEAAALVNGILGNMKDHKGSKK